MLLILFLEDGYIIETISLYTWKHQKNDNSLMQTCETVPV